MNFVEKGLIYLIVLVLKDCCNSLRRNRHFIIGLRMAVGGFCLHSAVAEFEGNCCNICVCVQ